MEPSSPNERSKESYTDPEDGNEGVIDAALVEAARPERLWQFVSRADIVNELARRSEEEDFPLEEDAKIAFSSVPGSPDARTQAATARRAYEEAEYSEGTNRVDDATERLSTLAEQNGNLGATIENNADATAALFYAELSDINAMSEADLSEKRAAIESAERHYHEVSTEDSNSMASVKARIEAVRAVDVLRAAERSWNRRRGLLNSSFATALSGLKLSGAPAALAERLLEEAETQKDDISFRFHLPENLERSENILETVKLHGKQFASQEVAALEDGFAEMKKHDREERARNWHPSVRSKILIALTALALNSSFLEHEPDLAALILKKKTERTRRAKTGITTPSRPPGREFAESIPSKDGCRRIRRIRSSAERSPR